MKGAQNLSIHLERGALMETYNTRKERKAAEKAVRRKANIETFIIWWPIIWDVFKEGLNFILELKQQ